MNTRAPTTPAVYADPQLNSCLTLNYDASGLQTVYIQQAPLIGWYVDMANLAAPALPQTIGLLPVVPPDTSPIISPQYGIVYSAWSVLALDAVGKIVFTGTLRELFSFLARNNGAQRTLSPQLMGMVFNEFNLWNIAA